MPKILETDLFAPIKNYFEGLGFRVNAEVKSCDVTASKDSLLIAIELKTSFNMTVLLQALDRQKAADKVYIAVPMGAKIVEGKRRDLRHICERLNIGLILVGIAAVEVLCEPDPPTKLKNNIKKRSVLKEIENRKFDTNIGGSTRKKLMTAFRERNILIAYNLLRHGQEKPSALIKLYNCPSDTRQILYSNFYGWYNRLGGGFYELSEKGQAELFEQDNLALIENIRAGLIIP